MFDAHAVEQHAGARPIAIAASARVLASWADRTVDPEDLLLAAEAGEAESGARAGDR